MYVSGKPEGKKGPPGKKGAPTGKEGGKKGPPGGPPKGPPKLGVKKAIGSGGGPVSKTKKLFWDPVSDISNTIWASKEHLGIQIGDIETIFAKAAPKQEGELKREAKPKVLQILPDSKRSYNMNIALSRFNNYTFAQLRDAVLDLTPEILTVDASETLILFAPLPEENTAVEEYIKSGADLKLLDKPEQFVAAMLGVPLIKQRLDCHKFALTFMENWDGLTAPLDHYLSAIEQTRNSTSLKAILTVVLDIGNEMNKGAEISGFRLSTLNKLNDVRTVTKPVRTVLQYIVDIIYDQKPELLELAKQISSVERAVRVDSSSLEAGLQQLDIGLKRVTAVVEQARKRNADVGPMDDRDPLPDIMHEFLVEAEPRLAELQEKFNLVKARFVELAVFFGEPEKQAEKLKPEQLFNEVVKFARDVEATRKDKFEKEERERKRRAAKEKALGKLSSPLPEKKESIEAIVKNVEVKPETAVPQLKGYPSAPELKSSAILGNGKGKQLGAVQPSWFGKGGGSAETIEI